MHKMTVEDEVRLVDSMIDLYATAHRYDSSKSDMEVIEAAVPDIESLKAYTHKQIEQCRYRGKHENRFVTFVRYIATSRKCGGKFVRSCAIAARVYCFVIRF